VPSLAYVTTNVHVDAPALGLFLMGSYFLLRAQEVNRKLSDRFTVLAGVFAGLSVSCKLTLLAGVFALVLFALWSLDWKRAAGLALSAILTVCIVYGWIIVRDGFPAVIFSIRVLARFPWAKHNFVLGFATLPDTSMRISEKVLTSVVLVRAYLRDYGILIIATLTLIRLPKHQDAHKDALPSNQLVWLFLLIAVIVMPASVASVAKYGGAVNSRAIFTLPLTLASIFALWATVHRADLSGGVATCAALMGAVIIVALSVPGKLKMINFGRSIMEEAYATIKAHPSQCYFPYDPLAHLLAGDRFRPNVDVIYSYAVGGLPVNKVAFDASMPQGIKYVMAPPIWEFWGFSELRRLLPVEDVLTRDFNLEHHEVWGLKGITHSDFEMEMVRQPSVRRE
jgi:hypothetical protein